jgi:hypothetical protein
MQSSAASAVTLPPTPTDRRQALRHRLLATPLLPPLIFIVLEYCLFDSFEMWEFIVGKPQFGKAARYGQS